MSRTSDAGQIRMRAAIYVPAMERRDNCGGCTYSDARKYSDHWCRLHSAPTTRGAICALHEQPKSGGRPT